jgi:hypothetical protein
MADAKHDKSRRACVTIVRGGIPRVASIEFTLREALEAQRSVAARRAHPRRRRRQLGGGLFVLVPDLRARVNGA